MKRLLPVLLLLACSENQPAPTDSTSIMPLLSAVEARGPYIVALVPGADAQGLARGLGVAMEHRYRTVLNGFSANLPDAAVEALRRSPQVRYVEPDGLMSIDEVGSWGLDRVDQRSLPLDDSYTPDGDGSGVDVYIVDTGILYNHAEFEGRAGPGWDVDGGEGWDCQGHGTHVAGTVGGATVGVASGVNLISVRVFGGCGGSTPTSTVIAGLDWIGATVTPPAVANMSLGDAAERAMDDAVRALTELGVSVAVSAGNENADACTKSPAREPAAITVGATDALDQRASFSNFGACLDLFAPGVAIRSAALSAESYRTLSGTSMSSPHAAGAAAIVLAKNAGWTAAQVAADLRSRATPGVVTSCLSPTCDLLYVLGAPVTDPAPPQPPPDPPAPPAEPPAFTLTAGTVHRTATVRWGEVDEGVSTVQFRWRVKDISATCAGGGPCHHGGWRVLDAVDVGAGSVETDRMRSDHFDQLGSRVVQFQVRITTGDRDWRPIEAPPEVEVCETRGGGTRCR